MKQPKTLSELYIAAKTDTGYKDVFLKEAKRLYSGFIPNAATFDQTVHIFKSKSILNENYVDLKSSNSYEGREQEGWETKFKSFLKEEETSEIQKAIDDYITFYTLPPQIDYTRPYKIKADKAEAYLRSLPDGQKYIDQAERKIESYYGEEDEYGNSMAYYDSLFESKNIGKYALIVYNTKKNNNISQVLYKGVLSNVVMYSNNKEILEKKKEERATKNKSAKGVDKIVLTSELKKATKSVNESQEESVKADISKQSKYVDDVRKNSYDNSDVKNLDNQIGQEVLNGIYFEGKENPDKTLDELRAIVSKNLAKDPLYYVKNAMFGVKGVGVSDEIPGLKVSKTDQMEKVKMKSLNEAKENKLEQRLKDIDKAGGLATIEAKIAAVDEEITARTERLNMIDENEDLAELVNPVKLREMKKEIKVLEKEKAKFQKLYEKITGKKKQEVVGEVEDESEELNEELEADIPLKKYEFEIYTKNPDTGEEGWDIEFVLIIAENYKEAVERLKTYNLFDTIITKQYLGDISKGDMDSEEYKAYKNMVISDSEQLNEGEQYGKSPEEDKFLRKVKEENPNMLTKFISLVKNKGLEIAKEKYNEFDPEIISQNKTKASSEENDKKLLISFSKFLPKKLPELWEKTMEKTGEAEDGAFYLLLGALISKYGDRYGDDKADRIDTLITGFGLNDEEYTDKIDEFWWNLIDEKYGKHVIEW